MSAAEMVHTMIQHNKVYYHDYMIIFGLKNRFEPCCASHLNQVELSHKNSSSPLPYDMLAVYSIYMINRNANSL